MAGYDLTGKSDNDKSSLQEFFDNLKREQDKVAAQRDAERRSDPMYAYHKGLTSDLMPQQEIPAPISDKLTSIASRPVQSTPDIDSDGVPAYEDSLFSAPSAKAITLQQEKAMLTPPAEVVAPTSTLSKVSSSISLKQAPKPKSSVALKGVDMSTVPYEEPNLFGADMGDKALQQAQESRRYLDLIAGLGEAGATIGAAIAGTQAPKDLMAATRRAGEAGVSNILERRKGKLEEMTAKEAALKAKDLAEMSNPNSAVSKMDQSLVKDMASKLNLQLPAWMDTAPSTQLEKIKKTLEDRLTHQQKTDEMRLKTEELKLLKSKATDEKSSLFREKETQKIAGVLNKIEQENAKELGAVDLMKSAGELAQSGNELALSNVRKFIAKGVEGPTARVTDADAKQHLVSSYPRKIAEKLSEALDGKLTDITSKELQQLGNAVIEAQNIKSQKQKYNVVNRYLNVANIPKDERPKYMENLLLTPPELNVVNSADKAKVAAMVNQAALDGKTLTEEQAIKILKVKTYADLK